MEQFLQAVGLALVGVILALVVGKQSRDMSLLLSLGICCGICLTAAVYLTPVMEFLREIRKLGGIDSSFLAVLLKAAGIGFLAELAGLICADAGESAMGKAVQILANAAILWISLPMLRQLVTLLEEVLGKI